MRYLTLCLILLIPMPLYAVTGFTVNGQTGGNLATPGALDIACDCAPGVRVAIVLAADVNGNGAIDAHEPILDRLLVSDGYASDSDPLPGLIRYRHVQQTGVSMPVAVRVVEGSLHVEQGYLLTCDTGQYCTGTVYDRQGMPLAGLVIQAQADWGSGDGPLSLALTDVGGRYRLPVPAGRIFTLAPAGGHGLMVRPDHYFLELQAGEAKSGLNFQLCPEPGEVPVSGRLLDDRGAAAPGVAVAAEPGARPANSDINGEWTLWLAPGASLLRTSGGRGYGVLTGVECPVPGATPVEMIVPTLTRTLSGRVTLDGVPAGGSYVWVGGWPCYATADGGFRTWVPEGEYCVYAKAPGCYSDADGRWVGRAPADGLALELHPCPAWVWGRLQYETGEPAAGSVQIRTVPSCPLTFALAAVTDGAGRYRLPVPAGQWEILARVVGAMDRPFVPFACPPEAEVNFTFPGPAPRARLLEAMVSPSRGTPDTEFRYSVTYSSTGALPTEIYCFVNGRPHAMTKVTAGDDDARDGIAYEYRTTLRAGMPHNYAFMANYNAGGTSVRTATMNGPDLGLCSLEEPALTPGAGTPNTQFTASVIYRHAGGLAPANLWFAYRLDGGTETRMSMGSAWNDYAAGVTFTRQTTFYAGQISYRFILESPEGETITLPATGWYDGPNVQPVVLTPLGCSPVQGAPQDTFTFRLQCTSPYGTPGSVELVLQRAGSQTMTHHRCVHADPADPSQYLCQVRDLEPGSYQYWFTCTAAGQTFASVHCGGPLVGEAPPYIRLSPESGICSGVIHFTVTPRLTPADDPVVSVDYLVNGTPTATRAGAPYEWEWDTRPAAVSDGDHRVRAVARYQSGYQAEAESVLVLDNDTFDDVPKPNVPWAFVEAVAREGIMGAFDSANLFRPQLAESRAGVAMAVCRAIGLAPYANPVPTFGDVERLSEPYGSIEALYRARIMAGCGTNPMRFCPAATMTRAQLAVVLCRACGWTPYNAPRPSYVDMPPSSPCYGYVEELRRRGVVAGCAPGRFCPDSQVTRGQLAIFLCRAFSLPLGP